MFGSKVTASEYSVSSTPDGFVLSPFNAEPQPQSTEPKDTREIKDTNQVSETKTSEKTPSEKIKEITDNLTPLKKLQLYIRDSRSFGPNMVFTINTKLTNSPIKSNFEVLLTVKLYPDGRTGRCETHQVETYGLRRHEALHNAVTDMLQLFDDLYDFYGINKKRNDAYESFFAAQKQ